MLLENLIHLHPLLGCCPYGAVFAGDKAKSGYHRRETCSCCPYATFFLRARSLPSHLYTRSAAALTCYCASSDTIFESKKAKSTYGMERRHMQLHPCGTSSEGEKVKRKRDLQLLPLRFVSEPDFSHLIFKPSRLLPPPVAAPSVVRLCRVKKRHQVNIWGGKETPAAATPVVWFSGAKKRNHVNIWGEKETAAAAPPWSGF